MGAVIRKGTFAISAKEGPVPGSYRVRIYASSGIQARPTKGQTDHSSRPMVESLPEHYNAKTELRADVTGVRAESLSLRPELEQIGRRPPRRQVNIGITTFVAIIPLVLISFLESRNMKSRPRGFTLIELLVTIGIIAVLMAILLPAVQSAREAARRSQCVNNLKQIALAMHQYHGVHAVLPPGKKGCCWGTWLVYVLPYMEQEPLFNSWNSCGINAAGAPQNYDLDLRYFGVANQTVTSTFISSYLCPSDQTNAPITATTNGKTFACTSQNYAVNFGNSIVIQTNFQDI